MINYIVLYSALCSVLVVINSPAELLRLSSLDVTGDQSGKLKMTLNFCELLFATTASKLNDSPGPYNSDAP